MVFCFPGRPTAHLQVVLIYTVFILLKITPQSSNLTLLRTLHGCKRLVCLAAAFCATSSQKQLIKLRQRTPVEQSPIGTAIDALPHRYPFKCPLINSPTAGETHLAQSVGSCVYGVPRASCWPKSNLSAVVADCFLFGHL